MPEREREPARYAANATSAAAAQPSTARSRRCMCREGSTVGTGRARGERNRAARGAASARGGKVLREGGVPVTLSGYLRPSCRAALSGSPHMLATVDALLPLSLL